MADKTLKSDRDVSSVESNYPQITLTDDGIKKKKKRKRPSVDDETEESPCCSTNEYYNNSEIVKCKKKKRKKAIDTSEAHETNSFHNISNDETTCEIATKKLKKKLKSLPTNENNSCFDEENTMNECEEGKIKKKKRKRDNIESTNGDASTFPNGSSCFDEENKNTMNECEEGKIKKKKRKRDNIESTNRDASTSPNGSSNCSSDDTGNVEATASGQGTPSMSSNLASLRIGGSPSFSSLQGAVSSLTMDAVARLGFTAMTEVQAWAVPPLLEGNDLRATAKTGSGKTLAFLIPAIELLYRRNFTTQHGTGVLVLSPTRELAMQIHSVAEQLLQHSTSLSTGLVTGGVNKEQEARMLAQGVSVLVATPGRLLDHMRDSRSFCYERLACLVLDEADRMLAPNFEPQMMQILKLIPKDRQTMLFSATKTPKTNELVKVALKEDFVDIDATYSKDNVTSDNLDQTYLVCPLEKKFLFLLRFVNKQNEKHKMMVFFSSCDAVRFYQELLWSASVPVLAIHGNQKQEERTKAFRKFNAAQFATLLCTDVAARGWDIPGVTWVLQYDAPQDVSEYIHRVGRTARVDSKGSAMLLLRKEEVAFVEQLQRRKVNITEVAHVETHCTQDLQGTIEGLASREKYIKSWGRQAFKSCINAYALHKRKDIFNLYTLDIKKLGQSFGFQKPPRVDLAIQYKKSSHKKVMQRIRQGFYDQQEDEEDS